MTSRGNYFQDVEDTPKDVGEALRTLPKTLKETYDKILDSVPKRNQSYIRAALQWIAGSARPLSRDELAVAAVNDPTVAKSNGSEYNILEVTKRSTRCFLNL